ncbi:MAG: hypothetical protein NVSMB27_01980 [Ktedonobacteraceae bacterium]
MASYRLAPTFPPRFWIALATTLLAFIASLLASINLYLLEDNNPLTSAAYSASPLLRLSYDGVYLSALVAAVAICAIVIYTIVKTDVLVTTISLVIVALLVAFAGFGGLLIRYPVTFLILFLVFIGLALVSLLSGRAVAAWSGQRLGQRAAAIIGACVSTGIALLVNVAAMLLHTLALNPLSHTLFMQGQIGNTHFNSLIIALSIELLTTIICLLSVSFALRSPLPSS